MISKYKINYFNMKGGNDHDRTEFQIIQIN